MWARAVLWVLVAIAAIPAYALASPAHPRGATRISVTPSSGSPTTRFLVSFANPDRTGRAGTLVRRDELSVQGPPRARGCIATAHLKLPPAPRHARVSGALDPAVLGGAWCPGTYHGAIEETEQPWCPPATPCPQFVAIVRRLGVFAFRVLARPSSPGATAPTFGGLQAAFACTPGPQRPGQTTPFTLTWRAASDKRTPPALIVYDVFMSTRPGGEDFAHPTWTTPAGVTRFQTPGLPSHGTFYFVVRARDRAGNEDRNRVERRGVDPCL